MTALKAHEVDRYLAKPDLEMGIYLVYGSDAGRIRETARQLIKFHGGDSSDPLSHLTLESSDIDSDPARLAMEARTPSLFGGTRTIRVRNASKSLTPLCAALLEERCETIIVLEAGSLVRSDSLRTLIEKHANARALPCFADDAATLVQAIRAHFEGQGITISSEAVATLRDILGNDRAVTRQELEKLSLYAANSKRLEQEDIFILSGDNNMLTLDAILDAAGTGKIADLDMHLSRALAAGTQPQRILSAALVHFTWLRRLRVEIDTGKRAREILQSARPRPHFSRNGALETQLRLWTDAALANASDRIYTAIAECRKSTTLTSAVTQRALLAICVAAAHK